jgi:hypothetical protein
MTGCVAARSVMAKARSREATITKVVKVEAVVDVEDEFEIRVSGSDQTVVGSAAVKVKIEENRNGRASRQQQSTGVVSNSVVTVLRTKMAGVDKACSDTGRL